MNIKYKASKNEFQDIPKGAIIDAYLIYKCETTNIGLIYIPKKVSYKHNNVIQTSKSKSGCMCFAIKNKNNIWEYKSDVFINYTVNKLEPIEEFI